MNNAHKRQLPKENILQVRHTDTNEFAHYVWSLGKCRHNFDTDLPDETVIVSNAVKCETVFDKSGQPMYSNRYFAMASYNPIADTWMMLSDWTRV